MERDKLLLATIEKLQKLPHQKLQEVADFADFIMYRLDNQLISQNMSKLQEQGGTFEFLEIEPDLYTLSDVQEKYQ
jgi:hypothetical protein